MTLVTKTSSLVLSIESNEMDHRDKANEYGNQCNDTANETGNEHDKMKHWLLVGRARLVLKQYDKAIDYGKKCLVKSKETGDQHIEMNACLVIGKAYIALEQYDKARSYVKMCLDIAKQTGDKEIDKISFLMGETYFKLNQYEEAVCYFKMCRDISEATGDKDKEIKACLKLADVYKFLTDVKYRKAKMDNYEELSEKFLYLKRNFSEAIVYGKKCIDIAKEIGDKICMMWAYFLIGESYYNQNHHDNAVFYYKRSIGIANEIGGKEFELIVIFRLVNILNLLNQIVEAYSQLKRAYDIAKELNDLQATKKALSALLRLNKTLNNETDLKIYADELITISKETGDVFSEIYAAATLLSFEAGNLRDQLHNVFHQFIKLREVTSISSLFEKSLKVLPLLEITLDNLQDFLINLIQDRFFEKIKITDYFKMLLNEWFSTFSNTIKTFDSLMEYNAQFFLLLGMSQYLFKEKMGAKASLKESINYFESTFNNLHNVDKSKISIFDKYVVAYKLLSKIYIEEDQKEEALLVSERCRSRSLKDILKYGMKQDVVIDDGNDIQLTDIQSLVKTNKFSIVFYSVCLNDLHTFLIDGNGLHFSSQPLQGSSIYDLEQYIEKAFEEMKVRQVVNCENFNQDTENNQETKETSAQSCSDFRFGGEPTENCDESSLFSTFKVLHKKLLGEASINREDIKEIVIIPDGSLFKVPFAALQDPDTGCYLSENRRIRLAPSLTTLKLFSDRREDFYIKTGVLVIGDPAVGRMNLNGVETEVPPLKNARGEALGIAGSLGVTALIGSSATKPAVIKKLQEGVSVVHIAAHGNLQKATILLAPSPETRASKELPDEEDYMLTMVDVQETQVRAQLVVLSCCYSGRGEIRAEGVVGMCRAFLASGARAVVASLWNIDDEATNEFMTIFYCNLKEGKSASTSLHLTVNEMRANPVYKERKYWAPFFLMGDDVTIKFDSIRQS